MLKGLMLVAVFAIMVNTSTHAGLLHTSYAGGGSGGGSSSGSGGGSFGGSIATSNIYTSRTIHTGSVGQGSGFAGGSSGGSGGGSGSNGGGFGVGYGAGIGYGFGNFGGHGVYGYNG